VTEPLFRREGDLLVPSAHTRGPWDPGQQHGGAPAALLAQHLARAEPGADAMALARVTYEFLGPVPIAPLRVAAEVVRPGRRLQVVEGTLAAPDGRALVRARGVRLRRGDVRLPPEVDRGAPPAEGPSEARAGAFPAGAGEHPEGFHRTAMELRFAGGTSYDAGPALAWFRLRLPLLDTEPALPVARVAAAADFGNGISRVLDFTTHLFVNTDLTLHVHREPAGEWVLLDARTRVEPTGSGLAWSVLADERGPLGLAAQTLFVDAR
jgi:acyl-Coa thioesterase superfamily protein/acyl-CoA thioesterase superfamily protein